MIEIRINRERCKGCGLCIEFCPSSILEASERMNEKGFNPVASTDPSLCTGCKNCVIVCPDGAIAIYGERKRAKTTSKIEEA